MKRSGGTGTGLAAAVLAMALALGACGGDSETEKACKDVAAAVGRAAERCSPGSGEPSRAAFENAVGGCDAIDEVRDRDSLYATCIPSLEVVTCEDLQAGTLDPSCQMQLLVYR